MVAYIFKDVQYVTNKSHPKLKIAIQHIPKILNKNSYRGLCNIGYRPTFNNDSEKITIETHLINQNINLYNENVEIEFISFLRHEKKFDSQVELVSQIKEDIKLM